MAKIENLHLRPIYSCALNFNEKYIFTCSTCGYQKESFFSTPIGVCPECEKKRTEQLIKNLRNNGTWNMVPIFLFMKGTH